MIESHELKNRDRYLKKLIGFQDTEPVKVITGIRRCGKSSLLKMIMEKAAGETLYEKESRPVETGEMKLASGLIISYISQDTSFLQGSIRDFVRSRELEESLYFALLRQLDLDRPQFGKNLEELSEGQKKKVLLAASLLTPAHLYIWDEPLNYIDVFSRIQIENLLLEYCPTLLAVEHDVRFQERTATRIISLDGKQRNL